MQDSTSANCKDIVLFVKTVSGVLWLLNLVDGIQNILCYRSEDIIGCTLISYYQEKVLLCNSL